MRYFLKWTQFYFDGKNMTMEFFLILNPTLPFKTEKNYKSDFQNTFYPYVTYYIVEFENWPGLCFIDDIAFFGLENLNV